MTIKGKNDVFDDKFPDLEAQLVGQLEKTALLGRYRFGPLSRLQTPFSTWYDNANANRSKLGKLGAIHLNTIFWLNRVAGDQCRFFILGSSLVMRDVLYKQSVTIFSGTRNVINAHARLFGGNKPKRSIERVTNHKCRSSGHVTHRGFPHLRSDLLGT